MKNLILYCLFLALFLISCSTSQFGWKSSTESKTDEGTPALIEDFDPLTLDDDDIIITPKDSKPVEKNRSQDRIQGNSETVSTDYSTGEMVQVQGHRVQLLTAKDEQKAWEAKREAILKFAEDVYLIHEASQYKLRVGDCQSYEEAKDLVGKAVQKGYHDAWIVRCKVNVLKSELPGQ